MNGKFADLSDRYLELLLARKRHDAANLVLTEARSGTDVRQLLLKVIQPAQVRIGELWERNRIGVAEEHYVSAASQHVMAKLSSFFERPPWNGRMLVATCVSEELHEIGMRIVADFFELDGWDIYYIGANAPARSIIETLNAAPVDVLGISATMHYHANEVRSLISAVREHTDGVKIIVGGYTFNSVDGLWQDVGADGHGRDGAEALAVAGRLFL